LPKIDPTRSPSDGYNVAKLANAPRQRRSHDLTLRVLSAAETVIRREGLDAFTITAVAREAKVSVGGLYGRFANREEIVFAIHAHTLERFEEGAAEWLSQPFPNYEAALIHFSERLVSFFEDNGGLFPGRTHAKAMPGDKSVNTEAALRDRLEAMLKSYSDDLPGIDLHDAAKMILHLLLASVLRETSTDARAVGRSVTWKKLKDVLPQVAVGYVKMLTERSVQA
jgi:AcrR family transcriptional regulator